MSEQQKTKVQSLFIRNEDLERVDRTCDLGDSCKAPVYLYPHRTQVPVMTKFVDAEAYQKCVEALRQIANNKKSGQFRDYLELMAIAGETLKELGEASE